MQARSMRITQFIVILSLHFIFLMHFALEIGNHYNGTEFKMHQMSNKIESFIVSLKMQLHKVELLNRDSSKSNHFQQTTLYGQMNLHTTFLQIIIESNLDTFSSLFDLLWQKKGSN